MAEPLLILALRGREFRHESTVAEQKARNRHVSTCQSEAEVMHQMTEQAVQGGLAVELVEDQPHRRLEERGALDYAEPVCQSLAGGPLDELVGRQVLMALEPAAVELSLRAAGDIQGERDRLDRQWRLRLERSRYEAERAARQYQACEPENRMVGRELERRWEQALTERRDAEEEFDRFRRGRPAELTGDEIAIRST